VNEELCLCHEDGSYDPLLDDKLAACIQKLPSGVRCLSICDCCHSGTLADLDTADFGSRSVMHLGAATDSQAAQDLGRGGALTSSILEVIASKVANHANPPTVVDIFNSCVAEYGESFEEDQQTLCIAKSKRCAPAKFAWPLWPGRGSDYDAETPLGEGYDEEDEDEYEYVYKDEEYDDSECDWADGVIDQAWGDMTSKQREAAVALGYSVEAWDGDDHVPTVDKSWSKLSSDERHAAAVLGYSQGTWDAK